MAKMGGREVISIDCETVSREISIYIHGEGGRHCATLVQLLTPENHLKKGFLADLMCTYFLCPISLYRFSYLLISFESPQLRVGCTRISKTLFQYKIVEKMISSVFV